MKMTATTVDEYLDSLAPEQRDVVSRVRKAIKKKMPKGYDEVCRWGGITWEIPLSKFPNTYNKQPLMYVMLASKKNYYALHMLRLYGDAKELARVQEGFKKARKKLDMGKACIRFKKIEDLPLDVITDSVARTTPKDWLQIFESSRKKS